MEVSSEILKKVYLLLKDELLEEIDLEDRPKDLSEAIKQLMMVHKCKRNYHR